MYAFRFRMAMTGVAAIAILCLFATGTAVAQGNDRAPVLIGFHQPPGLDEEALVRGAGGEVNHRYRIVNAIAANLPQQAVDALTQNPKVAYIEADAPLYPDVVPNDTDFDQLWGLNNTGQTGGTTDADIDAPEAWDVSTGSSSVVIAVIDTGAQVAPGASGNATTHPDLAANLWVNPNEIPGDGIDNDNNGFVDDVNGWNFFDDASWVYYDLSDSEDDHGTHVSGTIAAAGNNSQGVTGVNWQAQVMVLKFLGPSSGSTSDAIAAIEYAAANGADIINASWGGGGFSQTLKDAIENSGTVFCAAAGNGGIDQIGDDTDSSPHYPSAYDSANIIAVAATDHNDNRAGFSNFGATSVDLGAPGVSIRSTVLVDSYQNFSGTSMATPHVSGVAGLVLSVFPDLDALQIKGLILDTVDPNASLDGITVTGGRLNAATALTGSPPPPPEEPPASPDLATSDFSTDSGSRSGDYTDTHNQDDVYESFTEQHSGGRPSTRSDSLVHTWTFNVSGSNHNFNVDAYYADAGDADSGFIFQWSQSASGPWTNMLTVTKTSDNDGYQTFDMGAPSGTVYVRAIDTNQQSGQNSNDTLFVDHMYIDGGEPATDPPAAATNPSPANGATDVGINADLSWSAGSDATSYDVYFGTNSTPGAGEFQGNQTSKTFDPGTLNTFTTYYWRVDTVNSIGTTTGTVWSFTTGDVATTMHVAGISLGTQNMGKGQKAAQAIVTVVDKDGSPVANADVTGLFTGTITEAVVATTDGTGQAVLTTTGTAKGNVSIVFCVDNLTHASLTYDPNDNSVTCASQ